MDVQFGAFLLRQLSGIPNRILSGIEDAVCARCAGLADSPTSMAWDNVLLYLCHPYPLSFYPSYSTQPVRRRFSGHAS